MMYKIQHILIIDIYTLLWLDTFCMNSWDLMKNPSRVTASVAPSLVGMEELLGTSGPAESDAPWGTNGEPLVGNKNIWKGLPKSEEQ